jgi:hypothetical protein
VSKYGETAIHPVALVLTLAMALVMLRVRRDRAAIPLLVIACLVTPNQRIVVASLDFSMLRILVIFGWLRVLMRGETRDYRFQPLDGVLLAWQTMATIAYTFGPRGGMDAFVLRLGLTLDAAGTYFLFRVLLRDVRDVQRTVGVFSGLAFLMVGPMVIENLTGRNAFAALGGVAEHTIVRDGRLRCQASFSHPIMAGNFGASTAALIAAMWFGYPQQRHRQTAALLAAVAITLLSASSGPLMALVAACLGWGLWPYRRHLRAVRWVTVLSLTAIHFIREKPVWHLIGRLGKVTGGTGFHRYKLIDEFVNRFGEWWFLGAYTTSHWKIGATSKDVTNQYVIEGVRGGLPTLLCFVALLVVAFRSVGRCIETVLAIPGVPRREARRAALLAWGLGVCLFVHSIAFIGVSYFGQLLNVFYLQLAMIPSLACAISRAAAHSAAPAPAAAASAVRPPRLAVGSPA